VKGAVAGTPTRRTAVVVRGRAAKAVLDVLALGVLLVAAGCTVGPAHIVPIVPVEASFARGGSTVEPTPVDVEWWSAFRDPLLDALVQEAEDGNHDLRIAALRVLEARALRGVAAAAQLPAVDAAGFYAREELSENAPQTPPGAGGSSFDEFQLGFDAAWEVDLWGRVRRSVEAADAELEASVEQRRDVLVTLLAEVAREYLELRGLQRGLAITRANVSVQEDLLDLTLSLARAGLASEVDVSLARAQLYQTQSAGPPLLAGIERGVHRLSVLTGRQPLALRARLEPAGELPPNPQAIGTGLPSELLARRPDVRAVERELAAATARIGVATADLFPRVSLSGTIVAESTDAATLFDASSAQWGVGPRFVWPVFDAGRIRSQIAAAGTRQQQALARFEQTVLRALEETETALSRLRREEARAELLEAAVVSNRDAVDLARTRYASGLEPFLVVLDAQRRLFVSESELVESRTALGTNLVAVYKALGGGWDDTVAGGSAAG
jgi:NodT family efflux transporter outer membrane factor (OMF) lipoprotein